MMKKISFFFRKIITFFIRSYQRFLSPLFPNSCRYYPTCSEYAIQALKKYGLIRGVLKAILRILKCNPLFPGGYDPV